MGKTVLKKKKIPEHKLAMKNAKKGKRFSRVSPGKKETADDEEMM